MEPKQGRPQHLGLRAVLGILCVYHSGIGLASCLSADATVRFAGWFYGTSIELGPQFIYMLKALGMYAIFTAILLACALRDPMRHRPVILAVVLLLVMRSATRLIFFQTLADAFHVSWQHNLWNVALMLVQAALLLLWWPTSDGPGEGAAPQG